VAQRFSAAIAVFRAPDAAILRAQMTPKLYKAAEVCDLAQLQPFVLRSWEKEFPGIGIQKSSDSQRLYRQSDLDQLLRIKQLVFGEGLTLAGARRKIEESMPAPAVTAREVSEVIEVIGADVHKRIAHVRNGLRSILHLLDGRGDGYQLTAPDMSSPRLKPRPVAARHSDSTRTKSVARKVAPARGKPAKRVSRAR
jgi:DNA-binding transcriptional MerR regulator